MAIRALMIACTSLIVGTGPVLAQAYNCFYYDKDDLGRTIYQRDGVEGTQLFLNLQNCRNGGAPETRGTPAVISRPSPRPSVQKYYPKKEPYVLPRDRDEMAPARGN